MAARFACLAESVTAVLVPALRETVSVGVPAVAETSLAPWLL